MADTGSQKLTLEKTLHELAKFQFVLSEGRKGNHLLFDSETIRGTFARDSAELSVLFQSKLEEINGALNQTFQFPSFEEKRRFIRTLPGELQQAMIYGYFQLLEGTEEESVERILH
ncbi:MAG: hypothetical protein V1798_03295 [Pseudomonadota bacterium]